MTKSGKTPERMEILCPGGNGSWPTNQHYVWGYQPHFAIDLKIAAERLFKQLDDRMVPDTVLIAVRTDENEKIPLVVVEPHDHTLQPDLFDNVLEQVESSFKADPGKSFGYHQDDPKGEAWAKRQERGQYIGRIGRIIQQTISHTYGTNGPLVYMSAAREFGPYAVFGALLVPRNVYESHSHLNIAHRDEFSVHTSLIDAAASCLVDACWEALPQSGAGDGFIRFPTNESLLKKAGDLLMHTASYPCDNMQGLYGAFQMCNTIATLTYERSDSKGALILSRKHHMNVDQTLVLTNPINVRNYRAVRKLLQLPKPDEALLCDSSEIYGIGRISEGYDPTNEDLFCVEFVGHAKWQLLHAGVPLMHVEYGVPSVPAGRRQVEQFTETFERLFPGATQENVKVVAKIVAAAPRLRHGTILVIASDAEEEAERFGVQSTRIAPSQLTEELLNMGSRIDGAILASPDGICHAIGVILDGEATSKGSAERGARYNSAIRYVYGRETPCLALVISDDGMINSVPAYRPRLSRRQIEDHLEELRNLVGNDSVSQKTLNKQTEWFDNHRFYLTSEQCAEVNALIAEAEPKRDSSAGRVVYGEFKTHPDMNESFLRD